MAVTLKRHDVERLVYAFIGQGKTIDDTPDAAVERFLRNNYPGGLAAVADELGVTHTRPELIELLSWRGRQRWAELQVRRAARACVQAGCPLRTAAEAAGVSPQTVLNWSKA